MSKPIIKATDTGVLVGAGGGSNGSYIYSTAGRYTPPPTQLSIQEGDRTIVVSDMLMRLEYILQRAVPNYDELSEQFNAIRDIERSNNDIR
jgi:hypothetical protein